MGRVPEGHTNEGPLNAAYSEFSHSPKMPKNIRNLGLTTRLYNLLQTERSGPVGTPQLLDDVQPVIDMHRFNGITKTQATTETDTQALHAYVVPLGKAWTLYTATGYRTEAAGISVYVLVGAVAASFSLGAAGDTAKVVDMMQIRLTENTEVQIEFDTGVSGDMTSEILYVEEDV